MVFSRIKFAIVVIALGLAASAQAATLRVGADQPLKLPSEAAAVAKPGDTIDIEPGQYVDCAVWRQKDLTIAGSGPDVVIVDKICAGKGIFVIDGDNAVVRNITLKGARNAEGNAAGIRAEASGLKIDAVRFLDNENGIMSNPISDSVVDVADSQFTGNGSCVNVAGCAHGIYVGHIALLRVHHSTFLGTREGHHIKSRAVRTELTDNDIKDGTTGTASYLVEIPNGGSLVMDKNRLEKGARSTNHTAAITIGEEGVSQPTPELTVKNNDFTNDLPGEVMFVNNVTATKANLAGNHLTGNIRPLGGDGTVN